MTTRLEHGQKVMRGELPPPPFARLLELVAKSIMAGSVSSAREVIR
jgi:hypothetical protein